MIQAAQARLCGGLWFCCRSGVPSSVGLSAASVAIFGAVNTVAAVAALDQLDVDAGRLRRSGGELDQLLRRDHLAVLQLQPLRFQNPEQLLDDPAPLVPADDVPCLRGIGDRVRGQQPPVQRLGIRGRVDLAHLDQPQPHAGRQAAVGFAAGAADRHLAMAQFQGDAAPVLARMAWAVAES